MAAMFQRSNCGEGNGETTDYILACFLSAPIVLRF
jgi:hypothetical protein